MNMTLHNPPTVAAPFGDRFPHVARLDLDGGALLMLAGQVAVNDAGEVVNPRRRLRPSRAHLRDHPRDLAAHGAAFADVLHIRTFMTNLDDLPAYGAVRRKLPTSQHDRRGQPALPPRRGAGGRGHGSGEDNRMTRHHHATSSSGWGVGSLSPVKESKSRSPASTLDNTVAS